MSSVVVDTHTIIWYLSRSAKISLPAVNTMDAATASDSPIFIASITLVEMIYLVERNRIPTAALQDLMQQLARVDSPFAIAPLTTEVAQSLRQILQRCGARYARSHHCRHRPPSPNPTRHLRS